MNSRMPATAKGVVDCCRAMFKITQTIVGVAAPIRTASCEPRPLTAVAYAIVEMMPLPSPRAATKIASCRGLTVRADRSGAARMRAGRAEGTAKRSAVVVGAKAPRS